MKSREAEKKRFKFMVWFLAVVGISTVAYVTYLFSSGNSSLAKGFIIPNTVILILWIIILISGVRKGYGR